ncbi:uncharacterized protein LOC127418298 isoform X3 [Myxocyprinus asiaticus]|uniref:uncharacterized protein LOC127418298 isoform X3 n=1 Tax=Myxocyprinus asiaticus TaxID=70543 RepID=UPI00222204DB|nr:uncharacterized protein LOC127418298 isoform X3 [Myxocyprinus asiaticus]
MKTHSICVLMQFNHYNHRRWIVPLTWTPTWPLAWWPSVTSPLLWDVNLLLELHEDAECVVIRPLIPSWFLEARVMMGGRFLALSEGVRLTVSRRAGGEIRNVDLIEDGREIFNLFISTGKRMKMRIAQRSPSDPLECSVEHRVISTCPARWRLNGHSFKSDVTSLCHEVAPESSDELHLYSANKIVGSKSRKHFRGISTPDDVMV